MGGFRSSLWREGSQLIRYGSALDASHVTDSFGALNDYVERHSSSSPVWAITPSGIINVVPIAGSQSTLVSSSFFAADGYAEAVTSQSKDSGVVGRLTDVNNYYLFAISDDSGSTPTTNYRLFKRVGGTFTQLGSSVNATWARGTARTFRLSCVGTTITCLVDGVSQISVTDSALAGPGYFGMRGNAADTDLFTSFKRGPA